MSFIKNKVSISNVNITVLFLTSKPTNKIFTVIILCLMAFPTLLAQSVNDYRSINDGNWTDASIWEIYNGTAWITTTTYPGEVTGTNDVSIEGGNVIVLDSNIPNTFNSLTVGDNTAGIDRLEINADSSLLLNTLTITGTGEIEWTRTTSTTLSLPANTIVSLENGGVFVTDNPCNSNKKLAIGGSIYASCNGGGGGVDYEFEDINTGGGTLQVVPTSNAPICLGETLNLFANAAGQKPPPATTYTFSWLGSGPGYTFSSSVENPVITSLVNTGSYTYNVTITDDDNASYSFTGTVEVIVGASPNPPIRGGNQRICNGNPISPLTVTVNSGETADWYNAATGGSLELGNNTSFTPTAAGSYFVEARNTTTGCVSTTRTEVVLSISSCKVITNRRITVRVRKN